MQFGVSFIALGWPNRSFQRTQSFHFLNRSLFRSSPVVINLRWRLKEYCQKIERQIWDICKEFSVWHFVTKTTGLKPKMWSHFSESRDPSYVNSAKCPKCPRKEWRTKLFRLQSTLAYTHGKAAQSLSKDQVVLLHLRPCLVRLGVEPAELSEIAVDHGVFRVLLGLLPPRLSPKEKRPRKWENERVFRPSFNLSICKIFFSLFAESECRIQIIKRIWTETCVF